MSIAVRVIGENYLPVMAIDTARVTIGDAFLLEFLYTYALCTTVLNTATTASLHGNQFYGLAIGFVVLAAATSIGPVTGAALSPAFATAFCVIHRSGGGILWMYWISELLAGFGTATGVDKSLPFVASAFFALLAAFNPVPTRDLDVVFGRGVAASFLPCTQSK